MVLCLVKPLPHCDLRRQLGLTLIEVLIALAIVGIAMTAISKAISENIRATSYLQDKTMAMWVGQYVVNEVRAGILKLPDSQEKLKGPMEMLNKTWYWQVYQAETPNQRIKKIMVDVYASEDEDANPLLSVEAYAYNDE